MKVSELVKLGQNALVAFDRYIVDKKIDPPIRVYIRHFTTELEVSETDCRTQGSSEIVPKPDWSKTVFDFMEERIKSLPEFQQLGQSIATRYKKNINKLAEGCNEVSQVTFWLETFVQRLLHEKLEGKLSDDSLMEYASLFKSELELSPLEHMLVSYLDGIFLESDYIRINDNVLIRKTRKDDLEYTTELFIDNPRPLFMGIPSSILETHTYAIDQKDCHEIVNRILDSLRLYKLGSVYRLELVSIRGTIIWPGGSVRSWGHENYSSNRKYTVKEPEVDSFIKFVNVIAEKLAFNKEEKEYRTLSISIERYRSALLESVDIDRKLMTAVMGLESIFTLERDRGENAFKLGIRVAKLLGSLGLDSQRIRKVTEDAYSYRNKVVHGSYITPEERKKMNNLLTQVLNYLRVSVVIFLLNQETGKDKMIDIIDQSTISPFKDEELKKLLEEETREIGGVLV
ncbi:MAG: hypothetical protein HY669_01785 [Chloroflexi bacterium]|nr:hypothetical protein [Chloroflexota bacterium]